MCNEVSELGHTTQGTSAHPHKSWYSLLMLVSPFHLLLGPSKAPFNPLLSAPTLDELNQLVVWRVAAQWYEVGVFLEVGAAALDTIRTDNLHNVRQACRDMFREWLSRGPGTGEQPRVWQSVLEAVKETVGETVAGEIEREAFPQATSPLEVNQDNCDSE